MIKFIEQEKKVLEFKPGTVVVDKYDSSKVLLIVEDHDGFAEVGCFAGIYLPSARNSSSFSKEYEGWELYSGQVVIEN